MEVIDRVIIREQQDLGKYNQPNPVKVKIDNDTVLYTY